MFLGITSNLVSLNFLCFFLFFFFFWLFVLLFFLFNFLRFFLSESDKLELEDVSDSGPSLDDELDVEELDNDDKLWCFRFEIFLV